MNKTELNNKTENEAMTQILILLVLPLMIAATSCAQTVKNNFQENVSESERVINNKRAKEKTIAVSVTKASVNETYDYVFEPASSSGISISIESENPRIGFSVIYKDQNISGAKPLKSWKMDSGVNDSLTIRVSLKDAPSGALSFKLRIVQ